MSSGRAEWSTPFGTAASTLTCSAGTVSTACAFRCQAGARPSGTPTGRRASRLRSCGPLIEGSEDFDEAQVVDAIARTDYDQPVARQRTVAPPPEPALMREGGLFRRFLDGFCYR